MTFDIWSDLEKNKAFSKVNSKLLSPFDERYMTTIRIKFGDIFNTMLPMNYYVGQGIFFEEMNSILKTVHYFLPIIVSLSIVYQ